jgi:hypothetical protein
MRVMNLRGRPGFLIDREDFCYGWDFQSPNFDGVVGYPVLI